MPTPTPLPMPMSLLVPRPVHMPHAHAYAHEPCPMPVSMPMATKFQMFVFTYHIVTYHLSLFGYSLWHINCSWLLISNYSAGAHAYHPVYAYANASAYAHALFPCPSTKYQLWWNMSFQATSFSAHTYTHKPLLVPMLPSCAYVITDACPCPLLRQGLCR